MDGEFDALDVDAMRTQLINMHQLQAQSELEAQQLRVQKQKQYENMLVASEMMQNMQYNASTIQQLQQQHLQQQYAIQQMQMQATLGSRPETLESLVEPPPLVDMNPCPTSREHALATIQPLEPEDTYDSMQDMDIQESCIPPNIDLSGWETQQPCQQQNDMYTPTPSLSVSPSTEMINQILASNESFPAQYFANHYYPAHFFGHERIGSIGKKGKRRRATGRATIDPASGKKLITAATCVECYKAKKKCIYSLGSEVCFRCAKKGGKCVKRVDRRCQKIWTETGRKMPSGVKREQVKSKPEPKKEETREINNQMNIEGPITSVGSNPPVVRIYNTVLPRISDDYPLEYVPPAASWNQL